MNRYPVSYGYEADTYCTDNGCILKAIGARIMPQDRQNAGAGAWYEALVEYALDRVAKARGIADRQDERSFDSCSFPNSTTPVFPKSNFSEDHSECDPLCCYQRCAGCGSVMDGVSGGLGKADICPVSKENS